MKTGINLVGHFLNFKIKEFGQNKGVRADPIQPRASVVQIWKIGGNVHISYLFLYITDGAALGFLF